MHKIFKHTLFKVFTLNGFSVFVKMIIGFLTVKLYASFLGPSGFALLGNFKNFTGFFKQISTLGYDSGIVALVAKNRNDEQELSQVFSSSLYTRLVFSIILSFVVLLFVNQLNTFVFNSEFSFQIIFVLFSVFLPFYSINTLLISYLNGLGRFQRVILINLLATLLGFLVTAFLIYNYGLKGGVVSLAISESLVILPTLLFFRKQGIKITFKNVKKRILKRLCQFSLMALTTAIVVNTSHFLIRGHLISKLSMEEAGCWEAMIRFSNYYMMIISSSLTLYYLPKFSEIKFKKELIFEIKRYLLFVLPVSVFFFLTLYFFRNEIVLIVFDESFIETSDLFFYYLLGDFIKIISIIFGYRILAKGMFIKYIVIEVSFYFCYVFGTYLLLNLNYDLQSVVISYFSANLISLFILILMYRFSILPKL